MIENLIGYRLIEIDNSGFKVEKDERAKTINEFLERVLSDKYDCEHCPPSEVYCYKCVARRVAEQMKEQKNENK